MRREFCTYFDSAYLSRGLALAASLQQHHPDHRLWVLCLDDDCYRDLERGHPSIVPIRLAEVEAHTPSLRDAKRSRRLIEYYFTCTPVLPLYVMDHAPDADRVTYLDADLFFFRSPEPLFEEINAASIAIVPHRFPPGMRHWEEYGVYNVGWLSFRRNATARLCLEWWRDRCLEWCFDRSEDGRFADQKYLDDWPERFDNVHVISHKGANLASWNLASFRISDRNGGVFVDDDPLIFFHFHHFRRTRGWLVETDLAVHRVRLNRVLKARVFTPYCRALDAVAARANRPFPTIRQNAMSSRRSVVGTLRAILAGHTLLYVAGRIQ